MIFKWTANYCFNYVVYQKLGEIEIVNLIDLHSKSIKELKSLVKLKNIDPVGAINNQYIIDAVKDADKVVLAWERSGSFQRRDKQVPRLLGGRPLYCFGKTSNVKPIYPKRNKNITLVQF